MNVQALRVDANKYRDAAQQLYDAGVYVTSREASLLADLNSHRSVWMAVSRGKIENRGIGNDQLFDVDDVLEVWPNGEGGKLMAAGGIKAVRQFVLDSRKGG